MHYCCDCLSRHIGLRHGIIYLDKFREYGINYTASDSIQTINYCPWCANILPPSLRTEWFERFERRTSLQDIEQWEYEHKEYKNGEWWENDKSLKLSQVYFNTNRSEAKARDISGKCCDRMVLNLNDDKFPFVFFPEYFLFAIILDDIGNVLPISYCPWCGVSLSNKDNEYDCNVTNIPISNMDDPRMKVYIEREDLWSKRFESS